MMELGQAITKLFSVEESSTLCGRKQGGSSVLVLSLLGEVRLVEQLHMKNPSFGLRFSLSDGARSSLRLWTLVRACRGRQSQSRSALNSLLAQLGTHLRSWVPAMADIQGNSRLLRNVASAAKRNNASLVVSSDK